jgi:hypothetical protein
MTVPTAISIKGAPLVPADEWAEGSSSHSISNVNSGGAAAAGKISLPSLARPRHSEIRFARSPYLSATPQTVAPGSSVYATMRALRSSGHRRRPVAESSTPPDRKKLQCIIHGETPSLFQTSEGFAKLTAQKKVGAETVCTEPSLEPLRLRGFHSPSPSSARCVKMLATSQNHVSLASVPFSPTHEAPIGRKG